MITCHKCAKEIGEEEAIRAKVVVQGYMVCWLAPAWCLDCAAKQRAKEQADK